MTTITTVGGWIVVLGVAALYFYLTNIKDANKSRRPASIKQARSTEVRKDVKPRRVVKDGGSDSGDQGGRSGEISQRKKAPQAVKLDVEQETFRSARTSRQPERDEEVDNKEFARQLSSVKTGTLLTSKPQNAARQKSVKQSRALEKKLPVENSSDNATAPSSATGGDADDDQSSLNSPELGATVAPPMNSDISDMLEAPAQGPAILRVTESAGPARPKEKARAAFDPVETKKQRQNRKKAELNKQIREQEEKERKILMEKQRRTAREAEGRAAKDGSAFLASNPPSTSAWVAPSGSTQRPKTAEVKQIDLLDTYEPSTKQPASDVPLEATYSESELVGSDWQKSLPSEEEQMRIAVEDTNWNVVKGKERGRKKKGADQDTTDKPSPAGGQDSTKARPASERSGPGQKWTTTLVHVESNGEVVESEKELQDSEWEVA
ncbi:hypothetical protein B7463_g6313, partial [Scytalidium lignicola]